MFALGKTYEDTGQKHYIHFLRQGKEPANPHTNNKKNHSRHNNSLILSIYQFIKIHFSMYYTYRNILKSKAKFSFREINVDITQFLYCLRPDI